MGKPMTKNPAEGRIRRIRLKAWSQRPWRNRQERGRALYKALPECAAATIRSRNVAQQPAWEKRRARRPRRHPRLCKGGRAVHRHVPHRARRKQRAARPPVLPGARAHTGYAHVRRRIQSGGGNAGNHGGRLTGKSRHALPLFMVPGARCQPVGGHRL